MAKCNQLILLPFKGLKIVLTFEWSIFSSLQWLASNPLVGWPRCRSIQPVTYIFIFIHHKGSDKNNNNSKEKQNNLTKQRNRVTCKFLDEFLIPFYQQQTRHLTTKHSLKVVYYFYTRCPKYYYQQCLKVYMLANADKPRKMTFKTVVCVKTTLGKETRNCVFLQSGEAECCFLSRQGHQNLSSSITPLHVSV